MSIPDAQKKKTDAKKITENWSNLGHKPSDSEVRSAALLAQEGLITSVENMWLKNSNTNLSDISQRQIRKLASIVRDRVCIVNISPIACLDIRYNGQCQMYIIRAVEHVHDKVTNPGPGHCNEGKGGDS